MKVTRDNINVAMSHCWGKLYFLNRAEVKTLSSSEWKPLDLKKIYPLGVAVDSAAAKTSYHPCESHPQDAGVLLIRADIESQTDSMHAKETLPCGHSSLSAY